MYEKYAKLRDRLGLLDTDVAKATGIGRSTFSDWKSGRSVPKNDKLQKIADALGVDLNYFIKDVEQETYYINDEARELAQFLWQNPEYRTLFDTYKTVRKDDIKFVKEMIERLTRD